MGGIKDTRAREEIRTLVRRENVVSGCASGAFLRLFLLAQESGALLFCIQGYYHKQTHKKEKENLHVPRIARRSESVLYSEFANAKQICNECFGTFKLVKMSFSLKEYCPDV